MHNTTAAIDLIMQTLTDWSSCEGAPSQTMLDLVWRTVVDIGTDEQIKRAGDLIADALIGEGNWTLANGGEAALSNDGRCAISYVEFLGDRLLFPRYCSPEGLERDTQTPDVVDRFVASL